VLSLVVFIVTVIIYPFNMSTTVYNFRFKKIKSWIQRYAPFLSFIIPVVDGDIVSQEQFVKDLSVEYYYDKIAGYYSLFTFVIFVSLLRFVFYSYNGAFYVVFEKVNRDFFAQLMYRYLYLFAFEVVTDGAIRYFMLKVQHINVSNLGRNATIYNYRSRFLFTVFMVYFLADTYYSLITTEPFQRYD
jgi:hypothetical protein